MRSKYAPPIVYSWIEWGRKGCTMEQTALCVPRQTMSPLCPPFFPPPLSLPIYLSIHPSILPTIDRRRNSSQSRLNDGRASRNWRNIVVQITEAAKRLQLQIALAGEASPRPRPRSSRPAGNQYSNSFLLTNEFTYKPRLARESINSSPHRERAAPRDFWPSKIFALPNFWALRSSNR